MKKAAIFDLDGTLLNTLESIAFCGNTTLEHFNIETIPVSVYPQFIGKGAPWLIEQVYKYAKISNIAFEEFSEYYMQIYNKYGNSNITAYNHINEMLDKLKELGIKCAVLTNKPHNIAIEVCDNYFKGKFDFVYGHRQGIAKKPDPFMLFELMKELGVKADECVYCGDSDVDVITAKAANVTMLGASWGFYGKQPFENADAILDDPLELIKYI